MSGNIGNNMYIKYQLVNTIGAYATTTAIIVIGQIFIGAGCYCILIIGYVILSELTENKFKQYSIITLNAIWYVSSYVGLSRRFLSLDFTFGTTSGITTSLSFCLYLMWDCSSIRCFS